MLATVPIKYKKSKIISNWNWFSRFSSEFAAALSIMMDPDDFHIFISKKRDKQDRKVEWNKVNEHSQTCHLLQIKDKDTMLSAETKTWLVYEYLNNQSSRTAALVVAILACSLMTERRNCRVRSLSLPFSQWSSNPMHDALVTSIIKLKFSIVSNIYICVKSNFRNMYSTLVCAVF
jgi:hypothetical protein